MINSFMELEVTLLEACEKAGVKPCNVRIDYGGAELYHGIRETTSDIDVTLYHQHVTNLVPADKVIWLPDLYHEDQHIPLVEYEGVDFHEIIGWVDESRVIRLPSGLMVMTLEAILEGRLVLNREKDQKPIELIKIKLGL